MNLKLYAELARLRHWIKNFFVFFPLIFSLKFVEPHLVGLSLVAFLSFSFASSFVYIVNDIVDRERDSSHPIKKSRPVASGRVSVRKAFIFSAFFMALSLTLSLLLLNFKTVIVLMLYIALNMLYNLNIKHLVILDVMSIALGFILRILAGAYAIYVPVSGWIVVTTLALSLFLGFAKRRHEMILLGSNSSDNRPVLREYTVQFLDLMIVVSMSLTIVFYSLYTMDPQNLLRFGTDKLIYTVFFVVYGLFRYAYLIYRRNEGGDPADLVIKDRGLLITISMWLVTTIVIIKGGY